MTKCIGIGGVQYIINNNREKILEKYVEEELEIKGLNVQIACGYAEYDIKTDKNFEDTRSRADKKMYESKRRLKRE